MSNKQLQQQQNANSTAVQKTNGGVTKSKNVTGLNGNANSFVRKQQSPKDREKERAERERIVLWFAPVLTLKYCVAESVILLQTYGKK